MIIPISLVTSNNFAMHHPFLYNRKISISLGLKYYIISDSLRRMLDKMFTTLLNILIEYL